MELSENFINILKNFSTINNNILIKENNGKIETKSKEGNIYATADVEERLPVDVCLYDVSSFLAVANAMKTNNIEFTEKCAKIHSGDSTARILFTDPMNIIYPTREIRIPDAVTTFKLFAEEFDNFVKVSGIMGLQNMGIISDGEKLVVRSFDPKIQNGNTHEVSVEPMQPLPDKYEFIVNLSSIKFLPGDYEVGCVRFTEDAQAVVFKNLTLPVMYAVSCENKSTYGGK